MDFTIGIVGKDFVLLGADCASINSIIRRKDNMDKMLPLSKHVAMTLAGPVGDCTNFGEYVQKNLKLNELRNGYAASPTATANFVRTTLAEALRSRGAYQVNLLVAGYKAGKPQLFFIDHLAALADVPYAAQGYGAHFTLATMDRFYKKDMTLEEAKDVMSKSIEEVKTRFLANLGTFKVRVVNAEGIQDVEM
eukprot:m.354005 g.354005  ORF g.354005 m.354005 type:complete len:193 (+) comp16895_c0_seq1:60-638(+)